MTYRYLPQPPKAWYRVENQCVFDTSNNNNLIPAEYYYQSALLNKGNVLQYKKNSSNLTKNQRYSQIAKGMWTNRTTTWATQSDTYTNPNMTSLKRVNYVEYPVNNLIPGQPNNQAGPFVTNDDNPFQCNNPSFKDGGNLICSITENPCSGISTTVKPSLNYYPTTDSNVPGAITLLYWNPKLQTWYPRQRYTMNNSGDKWPTNYKLFTSASTPNAPTLSFTKNNNNSITLSWTVIDSACVPITSFNIFQNNTLLIGINYNNNSFTINNLAKGTYQYFITALTNKYASPKSNTINITI
jgi:hypothetical protein